MQKKRQWITIMRIELGQTMMEQAHDGIAMRKDDPKYVRAVIDQWPKPDDPKEIRIVDEIRKEFFSTEWARDTFDQARVIQIRHLKDSLSHLQDPVYVHDETQDILAELADITGVGIVEGKENIDVLPKGKAVLIVTNHLGSYKLNSLTPEELREIGINGPVLPIFYPFPLYFSSMRPVAKKLENNLYEASFEYPGKVKEIYMASGSIEVPPPIEVKSLHQENQIKGRAPVLIESTKKLIREHPNAAIVSFPEGGTTGKRNGKGPYDMENFRGGSFLIAAAAGIPVLPVVQYFNPNSGFELKVFNPVFPEADKSKDYYQEIAKKTSDQMQAWLNQRKQSAGILLKP